MALLSDGNPNDTEALRVYETAILDVAHVEGIDLDVKLGLAAEEVSEDVLDILLDHTRTSDPQSTVRRTMGVVDVVVTRQLKRWHALHTLEIVYRDAFNNQLNDRYQAKFNEYQDLARSARDHTVRFGIGLSSNPIPQAQVPVLGAVAGLLPAATYYVQVAWLNLQQQEGEPSELTTFDGPAGSLLTVQAVSSPANATGWNVYIGATDSSVALQNSSPIGVGGTFTLPGTGLANGRPPGDGQLADVYVIGGPMLRRG
jgi:hypothetical protein